jgi:glycosyltransferase involved in cell wall biosynthesis
MNPLRIAYFVAGNELSGGIRVILAQADALVRRGHEVTLIATVPPPTWRSTIARWKQVERWPDAGLSELDFVIGTFWTTVQSAYEAAGERAVHLCQGYEGAFTAYRELKPSIDAVYRLPVPKIVVTASLVEVCRQFTDDVTYIGQIVDDVFFQSRNESRGKRLRVLVSGPAQADMKGIDVAYEAVRIARAAGADFDLIRVSPWPPAAGEPTETAAEVHTAVDSSEMARLVATSDIFVGPHRSVEGFGLPAAEALASGVPAILSTIPSFLSWDTTHDYAVFTREGDASELAEALVRVLRDAPLRERLAQRGRQVAEQFRAEKTGERLERYFSARLPTRTSGR